MFIDFFNLDITHFFTLKYSSRTRGHTFKLLKEQIFRANSFSERVINSWNRLPTEVVTAPSLDVFNTKFDTFIGMLNLICKFIFVS